MGDWSQKCACMRPGKHNHFFVQGLGVECIVFMCYSQSEEMSKTAKTCKENMYERLPDHSHQTFNQVAIA